MVLNRASKPKETIQANIYGIYQNAEQRCATTIWSYIGLYGERMVIDARRYMILGELELEVPYHWYVETTLASGLR